MTNLPPSTLRTGCRPVLLAALVAACLLGTTPGEAAAQGAAREYDVKAALLFNLSQFVEWPDSTLPGADAPFVIGILGSDPFGKSLDELVRNERAHGRPIEIRRFRGVEDVDAQILFVSNSERKRLGQILTALKGRPVLTVGETASFLGPGGMIAFVNERKTLRLRIDLEAVRASGLVISARVLQLADVVGAGTE